VECWIVLAPEEGWIHDMEIRRPDWLRILMCRAVSSDVQMWGRRLSIRRRRMTDDMLFVVGVF